MQINISRQIFNPTFLPYLDDHHRYEVYWGGAGSGKSYFIAQKKVYKALKQKTNLLVVRQTGNTNRDSTFALFKQVINAWNIKQHCRINESDMRITLPNGSCIIFKGLDDAEKLKSITFESGELTDIWIEEASETLEEDFNQLNIRLRGGKAKKNTTVSFNPVNVNHWLKKRLFDKPPNDCVAIHSTYKDNNFLQDEDRALLESYKDVDPYYYTVYCLGQWGVYGKTIFDAAKVSERLASIKGPIKVGSFLFDTYHDEKHNVVKIRDDSIKWVDDPSGYISIYKDVAERCPYVIGGDTAGEGSDSFTGQVLDNTTGEQVAKLKHQFDDDLYARQMYCLGMYYNKSLIAIESNFSTYPIKELEKLGYTNMYVREKEDSFTNNIIKAYGFQTTSLTRPIIIAGLVTVVREDVSLVNDKETLEEMLTFVRNEKGRAEAQNGSHDDLIMGLAIAHYIRPRQRYELFPEPKPKPIYSFDFERPKPSATGYGQEIRII